TPPTSPPPPRCPPPPPPRATPRGPPPPRDHACRAVHRLPPADHALSAGQRRAQRRRVTPRLTGRLGDDMPPALAVEAEREVCQLCGQEVEPLLQFPPQDHQLEVRDMTVLQVEHGSGTIVLLEAHRPRPPSTAFHRQADLRPVPPLLDRLDDLGVLDVELGNPPQRIAHDRPLGGELRLVGDVLQL